MFEQSLYGVQKELQAKIGTNLIRNPFFVPDASTPSMPASWLLLAGGNPITLDPMGAPDGEPRVLVLPAGTIIESEYALPLNSGTDSGTLPEEFTFTVCVKTEITGTVGLLSVDILDGTGTTSITSITYLASDNQTTQSKSFSFTSGSTVYRSFKIRIHSDIQARLYLVSLVPGALAPDYIAQHALTESDLQLSNANTLDGLAAEALARQNADAAEAQARAQEDINLQNQINAEIQARQQGDTALQTELANYVDLTNTQNISGTKNFTQVTATHPAAAANDLVRKADMDAALSGLPSGSYVDLSTDQSVAGIKTFTTGIRSSVAPVNPTDVVRKTELDAFILSAGNSYSHYQKTNVGNPGYFDMTFNGGAESNFIGYYFQVVNGNLVCIHPCAILLIAKADVGNSPSTGGIEMILELTASLDNTVIDKDYWRIRGTVAGGNFILPAQTSISLVRNLTLGQVLKLSAALSGNGPDSWSNTYSSISVVVLPSVVLPPYQPPPPTSATITPNPAYAQVGQTVTFTVTSDGDTLSYQWSRNGSNIAGATNASYTTDVLTAGNNGDNYSCHIYNSSGFVDVSSSLQVSAAGSPTITTQPQDYEGLVGDIVELDIVATGATSWQWQRSGTLGGTYTNLTDGADYSGTTTTTLTDIGNVGYFRCIASNSHGSVTSNSAHVILNDPNP